MISKTFCSSLVLSCICAVQSIAAPVSTTLPGHYYLDCGPGNHPSQKELQQQLLDLGSELQIQSLAAIDCGIDWAELGGRDFSGLHRIVFKAEAAGLNEPKPDLISLLTSLPAVQACEAVLLRETSAWYPDDPGLTAQWHLKNVEAVAAWQIQRGNPEATIAILDTGVDMDHEDLQQAIWINPGEDLDGNGIFDMEDIDGLDNDENGLVDDIQGWDYVALQPGELWPGEDGFPADNDPDDFNGHGTHCSGIAAASGNNGMGVAGLGFDSRIMAIRIGFQSDTGQAFVGYSIEGLMLALAYGADVVSMSYGSSGDSQFEADLFWNMAQAGVICVGAAGNDNSTDTFYPAGYDNVISVAATSPDDSRAGYSNHGDWIDVGAPGSQILATTVGGGYGLLTGTSMACPLTAGLCGLLKGMHPDWHLGDVRDRIQATCDPVITNPGTMGAGRINAARAVEQVPYVSQTFVSDSRRRLPAGEWVEVSFKVFVPEEDPLAEAVIVLSTSDAELEFSETSVVVGTLFPGQETTVSTTMRYTGTDLRDLIFEMDLIDTAPEPIWQGSARVGGGLGTLLLIDADRSSNWDVTPWILDATAALDLGAETFSLRLPGMAWPDLQRYDHVIMYTGSDLEPDLDTQPFPESLMDSLQAFRAGGGHLLLSGQNLAQALPANWLETELGATVANPAAPGALVYGVAGESLTEGLQVLLIGAGGAENQEEMDVFFAPDARALLSWNADSADELAALRSNDGTLTVLGFGLEAVNGEPDWAINRTDLLARLLGMETAVEAPLSKVQSMQLARLWPNPFNPELNLEILLQNNAAVVVDIYNLAGARVASLDAGQLRAGQHRLSWKPQNVASGLYLLHLRDSAQSAQPVLYIR